eukprot:TRINITY_DN679_c0_g1_i1.p1 TRINITY_DN679_c0_g1~~TRINITY_DN679_c0_g1_i1.p1  ORF type:complete len:400 (+),score=91.14 TRINITY_DN679_c0_g1_i1:72-1271(+)
MARRQLNSLVTAGLAVALFFFIIYLFLHFRGTLPNDAVHSPDGTRVAAYVEQIDREHTESKKHLLSLRAEIAEREAAVKKREAQLLERESKLLEKETSGLSALQDTVKKLAQKVESGLSAGGGGTTRDRKNGELLLPALAPPVPTGKAKFAVITAYQGELYETMGMIADLTKEKYCELHGYHFLNDPSLFHQDMTWNQKSAIRLNLYRKHLKNYDWVVWSDSDVIFVNPNVKLESLVDDNYDCIVSRDWGDRQVNPGSMILRNSPGGWKLLDLWVEYIAKPETYHDDLRAFQLMTEQRKDIEERVKYIPQHNINAYPHFGMRDKSYDQLLKPENGHDLWKKGDFVVHVVDCIRDGGKKDPVCCAGLAAWYMKEFEFSYRSLIEDMRSKGAVTRRQDGEL